MLGYPGQTIRFQSDGDIVPYVTGFVDPTSGTNAGVVGGTHPLFEHVMLLRGYGVDDKIYQFRADLDIKGDNPKEGLADLRVGGYFSRDQKETALYSNDGLAGCATCGQGAHGQCSPHHRLHLCNRDSGGSPSSGSLKLSFLPGELHLTTTNARYYNKHLPIGAEVVVF